METGQAEKTEAASPQMAKAEFAIHAVDVHKNYLDNKVLRGFDLAVEKGKSFGCAGINGAGKSTFIKCLLDFCHYQSGTIKIFDLSSKNRLSRARLCFLPERFVPPYYLNGRQFIKFIMSLNNEKYDEAKAVEMVESIDLEIDALRKPVRSYSKGMTQKLGLATIFLLDRELYILDEPMSGLDPKARALVKLLLKKMHNMGKTLFFTSHSLPDIEEVCEEMALLHGGKVRYTGTPDDLLGQLGHVDNLEEAFMVLIEEPLDATRGEQPKT